MSIDQRYLRYLDHLGSTEPVRTLVERPDASDLVALRHDVDHDLDLALEMAFWEHQRGCRASYYMLHTASYWDDERLIDKCLQLQDFGHEVGLHLNLLADWVRGAVDDVEARLAELLAKLRRGGVDVAGVSAHGDRLCYEHGFANYWMFAELRPEDPETAETGRSAEGVKVDDARFQLTYPAGGSLKRDDGSSLPLWSTSLSDHALRYHAYHVPSDTYLSDSGGQWTRSADPLELDLSRGRHQVLMHPIYYRGPQRRYVFLSTARSGSKWLVDVLDAGTSLTARHEFTLNHYYDSSGTTFEKHTGAGFRSLMHQPAELRRLVADARTWVEDQIVGDWGEANIYLVHALAAVQQYFWDATLVHLHRHPYDVVRSLLERGWYETPDDERHPVVDVEGWESFSQMEKACHYVRRVNEDLLSLGLPRLGLEQVAADLPWLERRLTGLGISVYPRMAEPLHVRVVNASRSPGPPPDRWRAEDRRTLERICGPIAAALGYRRGVGIRSRAVACIRYGRQRRLASVDSALNQKAERPTLLLSSVNLDKGAPIAVFGGSIEVVDEDALLVRSDGERHTWILFGGSDMQQLGTGEGLPTAAGTFVSGRLLITVDNTDNADAAAFAFLFDADGHLMERRRLGNLGVSPPPKTLTFKPPANSSYFTLAAYIPKVDKETTIRISQLEIVRLPSPR